LECGVARDFITHRTLLSAGIYGIENLNDGIDQLPASGDTLMVLAGSSGSPARILALLPKSSILPHR